MVVIVQFGTLYIKEEDQVTLLIMLVVEGFAATPLALRFTALAD
jgi:hypothetical protein